MSISTPHRSFAAIGLVTAVLGGSLLAQDRQSGQGFSFRTSVDLVSVNATVTDRNGHFVPGLRAEDFAVLEDGERQTITQFETERVPVSLGIVLDTSGSMSGEKMTAAREAIGRFVDLLGPDDEMFLYRFDSRPMLVQGWTEDRRTLMRAAGIGDAYRRDGPLRCGRGGHSARGERDAAQEGARRDLGWQRYQQRNPGLRSPSADS